MRHPKCHPVLGVLLLTALGACSPADGPQAPIHHGDLALVGIVLLDPLADGPSAPSTLVIAGDRIVSVGPRDQMTLAEDVPTIDAAGLFLIPGLWDLHTHLAMLGDWAPRLLVTQGVTGIRDLGAVPEKIESIRHRIEAGTLLGPRVVRVGPTLNGAPNGPHHRVIDTPEAARLAVTELASAGFDLLKTHNATQREVYFALLDAAREAGVTVAGHIPTSVTPLEACQSGQASIEHIATLFEGTYLADFDNELTAFQAIPAWVDKELDALVACFVEHGTLFVPTLRAYDLRAHWAAWYDDPDPNVRHLPADVLATWRESSPPNAIDRRDDIIALRASLVEVGQEVVRRLAAAGAPFGAGTDIAAAGLLPGFDLHAEIRLFAQSGLSPQRAILAATRGPGEAAGGDPLDGRLVAGAPANLVLLGASAFESLDALDRIEGVVLRGRWLDRAQLDAVLGALATEG